MDHGWSIICTCGHRASVTEFSEVFDLLGVFRCPACGTCKKPPAALMPEEALLMSLKNRKEQGYGAS